MLQPHPGPAGVLRADGRGQRRVSVHAGGPPGLGRRAGASWTAAAAVAGVRGVGVLARPGAGGGQRAGATAPTQPGAVPGAGPPAHGAEGGGVRSAWVLVTEVFAWRDIRNGKELGSLVGLTPVPYQSGQSEREQGISQAGNKHVRGLIVELAWLWLRWQPGSALSQWYARRFGAGNKRARKVGIGGHARKLV